MRISGPLTLFKRIFAALVLLIVSGCLLWYALNTYRLSTRDPDLLESSSVRFFPEALYLKGNLQSLADPDLNAATESYRKAVLSEPSMIYAWIALARAESIRGNREQAAKIAAIISPALSSISMWKRQELLLAFDLKDESYFESCFNYILTYLPHHVRDAGSLGSRFWGSWENVLQHLSPKNRPAFLDVLMTAKQPEVAWSLWEIMNNEGTTIPSKDILRFCNFLIGNNQLEQAKKVWKLWNGNDPSLVHDGGFEVDPLNSAFGWRLSTHPDVVVERTTELPYSGKNCLHLRFKGEKNISFSHVVQVVPVKPETDYVLHFVRKSRSLTTDQGVFLNISGYRCEGLRAQSKLVTGSSPWTEEDVEFTTPPGCEALYLQVCRRESLRMDSKISGDYWLDAVEIKER